MPDIGAKFCITTGLVGGTSTGGPEFGSLLSLGAAGASQYLGGGIGGGGGGSFIGTYRFETLRFETLRIILGDCLLLCPETSEFLAGELKVFPEPLSEDEADKEIGGSDVRIGRNGAEPGNCPMPGTGKLITESGDLDFKLAGLKFKAGDTVFDTELTGEAEFEHGYEGVLELKLLLPKFSTLNTLCELDPLRTGLRSFRPEDPRGEKNSSSSSSSSSFPEEPISAFRYIGPKLCFGSGGSGLSSGDPSL